MGWFGRKDQFLSVLSVMGADRDSDGQFIITGEAPCVGIGGVDVAVPDGCQCLIGGEPVGVCPTLNSTSYGTSAVVII